MTSSVSILLTQAQRKVTADLLPKLSDRLKLDEKNQRKISFTSEELNFIQQKAAAARTHAKDGMKRHSLRHVVDAIAKALKDSEGIGSIPATERLYQFKITLLDVTPPIWRRIQVRNCTLDKLHERIQTAMGWTNSHLYQFMIDGERYGDPQLIDVPSDDYYCLDSTVSKISNVLPKSGERCQFKYEYDFGDSWHHEILFEGCLPTTKGIRYPVCIEGERACPPEDVGGVGGYAEYLQILVDVNDDRHEEMLRWRGKFDSEKFDAEKATKVMRRGLPDWRRYV
jgi:hypothetical protein